MWFVMMIAVIWGCSTIGAVVTKNVDCFGWAAGVTIIAGIGYFLLRGS